MILSSVSHEIRNPLHSIQGFLSLIQEENTIEIIKKHVKNIEQQIFRMSFLLEGTSDLLYSEAKEIYIEPISFDLKECVEQLLQIFLFDISSKNLILKLLYSPTVPEKICSVEEKFKIILFHLISNAIKYTDNGEIIIKIDYTKEDNLLQVAISDTGCGISEKNLGEIFTLYSQISSANIYNPQGMGLGLSLCKHLSAILGGTITASSTIGKGSKFKFSIYNVESDLSLPLRVKVSNIRGESTAEVNIIWHELKTQRILKEEAKKIPCTCPQALVVDDEACNRMVIKSYLESMNIRSDEATNGSIALKKIKERKHNPCCCKYQAIFMDINMPVMDGTEATAKLIEKYKNNPLLSTPIIAVTAASFESRKDLHNLLSVGFTKVIQKPISKKKFQNEVEFFFT